MKRIHPTFRVETYEEQRKAGRVNPAQVATYNRVRFTLPSGSHDTHSFWATPTRFYCLSVNARMGYAGLREFDRTDASVSGEAFIQSAEDLPPDFFDKSAASQRNTLLDYL